MVLPAALVSILALATVPDAGSRILQVDPSASRVTFTLDATAHTVEGSFVVRSGAVTLDPAAGTLSGEVVVDLASGRTGNDRRDRKMHEDVLESSRFPVAVLRPTRLVGSIPEAGSQDCIVEGSLSLHGGDHEMKIPVRVTVEGPELSVVGEFRVPYVGWGLEDPSFFVLRVAKEVAVRVELVGTLSVASPWPANKAPGGG